MLSRLDRARSIVTELSLDALIIQRKEDIFYLVGKLFSSAKILLCPDAIDLFVDARYFAQVKDMTCCNVILEEKKRWKQTLHNLKQGKEKKIGFDSSFLTFDQWRSLQNIDEKIEWIPISMPLKTLRACKDANEIRSLKQAAQMTFAGYKEILKCLKEGVTEEDIALEFEMFCRRQGAEALSFKPIVAFGKNSAYPHHQTSKTQLENNQIVLLDVGAVVDGYRGDFTRVCFFGKPDPELVRFYDLVKTAHELALAVVKPGIKLGMLNSIVEEFFIKEKVNHLFLHSLTHGIGLDVHEYPLKINNDQEALQELILQPGMVISIEPGLYLEGLGGVRYENTIAITNNKYENFYRD